MAKTIKRLAHGNLKVSAGCPDYCVSRDVTITIANMPFVDLLFNPMTVPTETEAAQRIWQDYSQPWQRYCTLTSGNSLEVGAMSPCRGAPQCVFRNIWPPVPTHSARTGASWRLALSFSDALPLPPHPRGYVLLFAAHGIRVDRGGPEPGLRTHVSDDRSGNV